MTAGWRILIAAAAVAVQLAGAAPALAQEAPPAATTNTPETVGPRELRDFQLNGTVTRPSQDAPASRPATASEAPATTTTPAPTQSGRTPPPPASAQRPPREPDRSSATVGSAAPSVTIDLPPPRPSAQLPEPSVTPLDEPTGAQFAPAPDPQPLAAESGGNLTLPWLLALLAVAGGAAFYFLRLRPRAQFAGAAGLSELLGPEPEPVAPPSPRQPAPAAGIVSTRLRPWLDIEFTPERTVVDNDKVSIEFVLSIFNSGSAPARDILVEGGLFNAGPLQDKQIALFFENPVAKGQRIPALAPLQRLAVRSAVALRRAEVQPIEVEGRVLLVPLVAFNALYRFGSAEGQTSASYLVGKQTKGEKLAPFRLDIGPRIFRGLAGRAHELRVRK